MVFSNLSISLFIRCPPVAIIPYYVPNIQNYLFQLSVGPIHEIRGDGAFPIEKLFSLLQKFLLKNSNLHFIESFVQLKSVRRFYEPVL